MEKRYSMQTLLKKNTKQGKDKTIYTWAYHIQTTENQRQKKNLARSQRGKTILYTEKQE